MRLQQAATVAFMWASHNMKVQILVGINHRQHQPKPPSVMIYSLSCRHHNVRMEIADVKIAHQAKNMDNHQGKLKMRAATHVLATATPMKKSSSMRTNPTCDNATHNANPPRKHAHTQNEYAH